RFQFRQGTKEQSSYAGRRRLTAKLRSKIEPEQSLAKLSMDATSNGQLQVRSRYGAVNVRKLLVYTDGRIDHDTVNGRGNRGVKDYRGKRRYDYNRQCIKRPVGGRSSRATSSGRDREHGRYDDRMVRFFPLRPSDRTGLR